MSATRVVATEEFDRRLPEERGARVTLTLQDGSTLVSEVPNPVGDVAYKPFGLAEIREKLEPLLEPVDLDPRSLEVIVRDLLGIRDVNEALARVP